MNRSLLRIAAGTFVATLSILTLLFTVNPSTNSAHAATPHICPSSATGGKGGKSQVQPNTTCPTGQLVLIDSFSHYMKESAISGTNSLYSDAQAMGTTDATKENAEIACTSTNTAEVLTILDFAQPWGTIGTRTWGGAYPTYTQAETATEYYIQAWKAKAAYCLDLTIVIGTNNSYICGSLTFVTCDASNGAALEKAADDLDINYGPDGIHAKGGSDIEVETNWSDYDSTKAWANGYFGAGTANMYDYGDDCQFVTVTNDCANNGSTWNQCRVYNLAWGIGYDEPVPEIYFTYQASDWAGSAEQYLQPQYENCSNFAADGPMQFYGIANEQWHRLGWSTAMTTFRNALNSAAYPNAPIVPSSTCFPYIDTNWPNDDCYNTNNV